MTYQCHQWEYTLEKWYKFSRKELYKNIHSSFSCNVHKQEITQMYFTGWIENPAMLYPCNGILFSNIKEYTTDA